MVYASLNDGKDKRSCTYAHSCDDCQNEKIVTYAQHRNIVTGKTKSVCKKCQFKNGTLKKVPPRGTPESEKKRLETRAKNKDNYKSTSTLFKYNHLFKVGPQYTEEGRKKLSESRGHLTKDKASNWRGGLCSESKLIRSSKKYAELRTKIFKRDDFTCQMCSKKGGELQMDHILEFANYPDKRMDEQNLRTLCKPCHKNTDNYGHKAVKKGKQLWLFS